MYTHKRIVSVTLDCERYEVLDIKLMAWNEVLGLEGDENVNVNIRELADIF